MNAMRITTVYEPETDTMRAEAETGQFLTEQKDHASTMPELIVASKLAEQLGVTEQQVTPISEAPNRWVFEIETADGQHDG